MCVSKLMNSGIYLFEKQALFLHFLLTHILKALGGGGTVRKKEAGILTHFVWQLLANTCTGLSTWAKTTSYQVKTTKILGLFVIAVNIPLKISWINMHWHKIVKFCNSVQLAYSKGSLTEMIL